MSSSIYIIHTCGGDCGDDKQTTHEINKRREKSHDQRINNNTITEKRAETNYIYTRHKSFNQLPHYNHYYQSLKM